MTLPALLTRLRPAKPTDLVTVTLTGHPRTVAALARAIAGVTQITGMTHHVGDTDTLIRIEATCHHHTKGRSHGEPPTQ